MRVGDGEDLAFGVVCGIRFLDGCVDSDAVKESWHGGMQLVP